MTRKRGPRKKSKIMLMRMMKNGEKEKETTSKTIGNVDWEEDIYTIREYPRKEYPLKTTEKVEEILRKNSVEYLDLSKYQKFSLNFNQKH